MLLVPYIAFFPLLPGSGARVSFIQDGPAHSCDDDAAGQLNDGQRNAKEFENGRAEQFNDCQEDDVIDCDSARQRAIEAWGRIGGQAKKDQGRPEWIDQRKKYAERDEKRIPKSQAHSPELNVSLSWRACARNSSDLFLRGPSFEKFAADRLLSLRLPVGSTGSN